MKNAKTLLLEFLAAVPAGKTIARLFVEDGALELPFLYSLGIEPRYQGHAAIEEFFTVLEKLYPDFRLKPEDIHVFIETPDQVFAEYTAHTTAASTGRLIHHLFAARLVAETVKLSWSENH
jgi:hypothetical protein